VLIPRVISDVLARHDAQVLAAFGDMGIPHTQQRTFTIFRWWRVNQVPFGWDSDYEYCVLYRYLYFTSSGALSKM